MLYSTKARILNTFRALLHELADRYESYFNLDPDDVMQYGDVKDVNIVIPIDGSIKLPKYINYLLEMPLMKRLSEIKQLAYTHMYLLGATHTRLEHSVGVMWKARRVLDEVKHYIENECGISIDYKDYVVLDLASILHDLGHPAWGHALDGISGLVTSILGKYLGRYLEKIMPPKKLDIAISIYLILQNKQLRKALDKIAENEIRDSVVRSLLPYILAQIISEEEDIGFEELVKLCEQDKNKYDEILTKITLFTTILGAYGSIGGVNVDRLDWLVRDAHHTALKFRLPDYAISKLEKICETIVNKKYKVKVHKCKYVIMDDDFRRQINYVREEVYKYIYEGLPRSFMDSLLTRLAYSVIQLIYNIGLRIVGRDTTAKAILGYLLLPDYMMIDYTVRVLSETKLYNIFSIIDETSELKYSVRSADLIELLDRLPYIARAIEVVESTFRYFKIPMGRTNYTVIIIDISKFSKIIENISKDLDISSERGLAKVYHSIIIPSRWDPVRGTGAIILEAELQSIMREAYVLVSHYAFRKIDDRFFSVDIKRRVRSLDELCRRLKDELGAESVMFVVVKESLGDEKILELASHAYDRLRRILVEKLVGDELNPRGFGEEAKTR